MLLCHGGLTSVDSITLRVYSWKEKAGAPEINQRPFLSTPLWTKDQVRETTAVCPQQAFVWCYLRYQGRLAPVSIWKGFLSPELQARTRIGATCFLFARKKSFLEVALIEQCAVTLNRKKGEIKLPQEYLNRYLFLLLGTLWWRRSARLDFIPTTPSVVEFPALNR